VAKRPAEALAATAKTGRRGEDWKQTAGNSFRERGIKNQESRVKSQESRFWAAGLIWFAVADCSLLIIHC